MGMRRTLATGAALGLLVALLAGCGAEPPRFPDAPVIFISVDTLRSDRLSSYNPESPVATPALDALAADSVMFERAYAQAPITLPSHASLFTGLTPPRHGVRENVGFKLSEDQETLAEALSAQGYETGAFVSSLVLRSTTGVAQGFGRYDDELTRPVSNRNVATFPQRPGNETIARAQDWLATRGDAPYFLFLHLYEPHTPYEPPAAYRQDHPYDGEVAYVDALVGEFLEWLKGRGLYDRAAIFFFSDHGEGLGDHGELEHGLFLYREAIQVPLMIKLPQGARAGTRVSTPAALIDLKATALDLAGAPAGTGEGLPLFSGNLARDRDIYSEAMTPELNYGWHAVRSAVHGRLHYLESDQPELFDLIDDPAERENLFGKRRTPDSAIALIETMRGGSQQKAAISQEERELLASLGYTGSFEMGDSVKSLSRLEFLQLFNRFGGIRAMINDKRYPEAEAELTELLEKYPDLLEFRLMLGHTLNLQEKYDASEHVHAEGLAVAPNHDGLLSGMTAALLGLGKVEAARALGDKCMAQSPQLNGRKMTLLFFEAGDYERARRYAAAMRETHPKLSFAYAVLGAVAGTDEDPAALKELLRAELAKAGAGLASDLSDALLFLGDSLARLDREREATLVFSACLERDPDHAGTRTALSKLYASRKMTRESVAVLDDWVANFPTRENYLAAADAMAEIGIEEAARFYREKAEAYPPAER